MLQSLLLFLCLAFSLPTAEEASGGRDNPDILILNPVDVSEFTVVPSLAGGIRTLFRETNRWKVLDTAYIRAKSAEYNLDLNAACHELTCSFDAGTILQADYTLYSTVTKFQDFFIYSLSLLYIPETKLVWSQVGEVPIRAEGGEYEALLHKYQQLIKNLDPDKIKIKDVPSKGILGILDLSPPSDYSHIFFDRLVAHAYSSGQYSLMGRKELQFVVEALNIKTAELSTDADSMLSLGEKLGLEYLIYSKLTKDSKDRFDLTLACFDIQKQKQIREWPYKTSDYRKLLTFEGTFFSSLNKLDPVDPPGDKKKKKLSRKTKWISAGVSLLAGGVFGYLAYRQHNRYEERRDDRLYALNGAQWEELDTQMRNAYHLRNAFFGLSGLGLAGAVVLMAF